MIQRNLFQEFFKNLIILKRMKRSKFVEKMQIFRNFSKNFRYYYSIQFILRIFQQFHLLFLKEKKIIFEKKITEKCLCIC